MTKLILGTLVAAALIGSAQDYSALWTAATPFHEFLENVRARRDQWRSRFANAAVDAEAISRARALPGRRRLLAVAEDRCSDSAWALPYLAKLAAAVPEKLELRVLTPAQGHGIQSAHRTPDDRTATPTIAILDDMNRPLGIWIERPAPLQEWYLANKALPTGERYDYVNSWYTKDAGRTTIQEVLAILERPAAEGE